MAIQILLNRKGRGQVENLIFDLTISENHTFETEITDNEVEEGFDINDNVHVKQPKLTMTGFREPGFFWKSPIPFVWGPIGGMSNIPLKYFPKMGIKTIFVTSGKYKTADEIVPFLKESLKPNLIFRDMQEILEKI